MSVQALAPRFAMLAVTGAAALSVAALSAAAPAHAQGDRVIGPIASVSGDTFQVTQSSGNATVEFTESTAVSEAIPAQLSDVTVGSCIKAGPTQESAPAENGAVTAGWLMVGTAVDGKCPQRPASASPETSAPGAQHRGIRGIVDSVSGNTVAVTRTEAAGGTSQATVTVTDTTHYRKRVAADSQAIAQGKCAVARGATDGNGAMHATKVTVWAATDGHCPQPTG